MNNSLLLEVLDRLKTEIGFHQIISTDDDYLVIQLNQDEQSLITITVADPVRPMYAVTHQALGPRTSSIKEAETQTPAVLLEGLLWIAKSVKKYSYVVPEVLNPSLRKEIKRRRTNNTHQ